MTIDTGIIVSLRPLWRTWPELVQRGWEAWLRDGPVDGRDETCVPPDSSMSVVTYARSYAYARNWASKHGYLTQDEVSTWSRGCLKELNAYFVTQGMACTTARAWFIAIDRVMCAFAPDYDREQLRIILKSIPRRSGINRKKGRIRDSNDLFQSGLEIMDAVLKCPGRDTAAAISYRIGLMIALLALRSYRRSVFASFDFVEDYSRSATYPGNHVYKESNQYLVICRKSRCGPRKVFGRLSRQFGVGRGRGGGKFAPNHQIVPAELTPYLDHYLLIFRGILRGSENDCGALWLSQDGGRLCSGMIYKDIAKTTGCAPQLFRDSYASTVRVRAPRSVSKAYRALGHTEKMTHDTYQHVDPSVTITVVYAPVRK